MNGGEQAAKTGAARPLKKPSIRRRFGLWLLGQEYPIPVVAGERYFPEAEPVRRERDVLDGHENVGFTIINAVNGKIIKYVEREERSNKVLGSYDNGTQLYLVPEGQSLIEGITSLLVKNRLNK